MNIEQKSVELLSLLNTDTNEVVVPAGVNAVHDAAKGPCNIKGKLINEGSITVSGGKKAKAIILAREVINRGKLTSDLKELTIACSAFENTGVIAAGDHFTLQSSSSKLNVSATSGSISAVSAITVVAPLGISVVDGTFSAPTINFTAEHGNVNVGAEKLDGEVNVQGKKATIGAKSGTLKLGKQLLLSGSHVYWNHGGDVSVGTINFPGDPVAILATGNIDAEDITAGSLTLAAGVTFDISGSTPPYVDDQHDDEDVSYAITSTYGFGDINIDGDVDVSTNIFYSCYRLIVVCDSFDLGDTLYSNAASIRVEADDHISIGGDITGDYAANIVLISDGPIGVGNIDIDNSETEDHAGGVYIQAYQSGGSEEFVIGGTGNDNGVNGQIVLNTVAGGGDYHDSTFYFAALIDNGGTGGITLTAATDISVVATESKSGGIILNAHDGTITLPAGTLSADGTSTYPGANIALLAATIDTADGTIVSASDANQNYQKTVVIAANTINFTGASGLTLRCNGGGYGSPYNESNITIVPKGSVTIDLYNDDPAFVSTYVYLPLGSYANSGAVEFVGDGSAPLTISCNGGSYNRIDLSGYPLTFSGGDVDIECKGDQDHTINIIKYDSTGDDGLQFNGGDVTIDASGQDGGDGGVITIDIDHVVRTEDGKVTVKADGDDSGNGGEIIFYPGGVEDPLVLGMDAEEFAFSAKGGSTDGDGGTINLYGWTSSIEVNDAGEMSTPIDVSAPGADGDGGTINIVAYGDDGLTFNGTDSSLKADSGTSSGNGGMIIIQTTNEPLLIDSGTEGDITLSAKSNGDGDGGTIDITSYSGITANAASLDVTADGSGTGGTLKLNAGYSTLSLESVEFNADGGEDGGDGGLIHLEGGQIEIDEEENTLLTANGADGGNGGTIEIVTQWASVDIGGDAGEISIEADAGSEEEEVQAVPLDDLTSNGGTFSCTQVENFAISGVAIAVNADAGGTGGHITIECTNTVTISDGTLYASGNGNGGGGLINITAPTVTLMSGAYLVANGGEDGGAGGTIHISSENPVDLNGFDTAVFSAIGNGPGEGGTVIIDEATNSDTESDGIDVNQLIVVDSGSDTDSTDFGGEIKLNGITCTRYVLGSSWPKCVWSSIGSTPSGDELLLPSWAAGLHENLKALLNDNNTNLYIHVTSADMASFFAIDDAPTAYGLTLATTIPVFDQIYVNQFMTQGGDDLSTESINESSTHELGHAVDFSLGFESASGSYNALVTSDFMNLDYTTVMSTKVASTRKVPCGPFDGIQDPVTGVPFCTSGTIESIFTGWINSRILQDRGGRFNALYIPGVGSGWYELFPQAFAYQAYLYTLDPTTTGDPLANGMFQNGEFALVLDFASYLLAGNLTPPVSPDTIPGWYVIADAT